MSEAREEQTTCELQLINTPVSAPVQRHLHSRLVLTHHSQECAPVLERPRLIGSCTFPKAIHLLSPSFRDISIQDGFAQKSTSLDHFLPCIWLYLMLQFLHLATAGVLCHWKIECSNRMDLGHENSPHQS